MLISLFRFSTAGVSLSALSGETAMDRSWWLVWEDLVRGEMDQFCFPLKVDHRFCGLSFPWHVPDLLHLWFLTTLDLDQKTRVRSFSAPPVFSATQKSEGRAVSDYLLPFMLSICQSLQIKPKHDRPSFSAMPQSGVTVIDLCLLVSFLM